MGGKKRVAEQFVATTGSLKEGLQGHGLNLADKTITFTTDFNVTRDVMIELSRRGVKVKAVTEGRDLGCDRAERGATRRQAHAERGRDASQTFGAVGYKLRKMKLKRSKEDASQSPVASLMYGATVHGAWPGKCLTTFLALEGSDPAIFTTRNQLKERFDLWSKSPDLWLGADGNQRRLPEDEAGGDPAGITYALRTDLQGQTWEQAAQHLNGRGAEAGVDTTDLAKHLEYLRTRGKHQEPGECDDLCERGTKEDDFHRTCGNCTARRTQHITDKTTGLVTRAGRGAEEVPAFWQRGLTPKAWTVPPTCETTEQESLIGLSAQEDRLRAPEGDTLTASGDGSEGEYTNDGRYRRCGGGWAILDTQGRTRSFEVKTAKFGPLPGAKQSNNRAELWAVTSCLEATSGKLHYWTDSKVTLRRK
ncbi:unnamed protein product [Prorocentrum cordatum]|uniref:RNase H type-1 domain-containing protein n=1 Tax=Prorocentrum cordatum TaxID=2364126 RepID=A0ABN9T215_9DINO|nr:unnamed protein product [Polarella glacialis]